MNSVKNYVWHSARDFAEDFIWRSIGEPMYNADILPRINFVGFFMQSLD